MKRLFLVLCLWSPIAFAVAPQLAVTEDDVCLLSEDQQLRCWSQEGKLFPDFLNAADPYLGPEGNVFWHNRDGGYFSPNANGELAIDGKETIAIASGGRTLCAIRKQRLFCRGVAVYGVNNSSDLRLTDYGKNLETAFSDLKDPQEIVADRWESETFCVWDAMKKQIGCTDAWHPDRPSKAIPMDDPPQEMAVGDDVLCAILAGGKLQCWGAADTGLYPAPEEADLLASPTSLAEPHDLTLDRDGQACVIDRKELHCWGKWKNEKKPSFEGVANPLFPHFLSLSPLSWIDFGRVHYESAGKAWSDGVNFLESKIPDATLAATGGGRFCVADAESLKCGDHQPFAHRSSVHFAPLGELTEILMAAANATYLDRRPPYLFAAQYMKGRSPATQAFLFGALAPLVEGSTSAAFETTIQPSYARALAYWGPLAGSLRETENREAALRLLIALIPKGEEAGWAPFKAAVGIALAEKGEGAALAALHQTVEQMKSVFDADALDARTAPAIQAIRGLLAGLETTEN